jgi:IS5 family transposase
VYDKPRGEEAKTRRSRDGILMTKNKETHFGYKMHMVMDLTWQLIRAFDVTTANVHDSQICFDFADRFIMYADKGYIEANFSYYKAYMLRKSNGTLININRQKRNWRISLKRVPVERPFSTFKEHGQDFTQLTTIPKNKVKMLFASILFNMQQIITISTLFFCHENYQKTRNESYYNNYLNLELLQKIREKDILSGKIKHKREKAMELIKERGTKSRTKKE